VLKAQFGSGEPQPRQVIQATQAGLVRSPRNPYFHYYLGEAYSKIGENDLALTEWSKALGDADSWAAPLAREAELLTSLLNAQEAVQVAKAAQRRAPDDPQVLLTLARAQVQTIDRAHTQTADELLQLLGQIETIKADIGETLPLRVRALAQSGRRDAAAETLRAALNQAKPIAPRVLLSLAVISRQLKLGLEQDCLNLAEKQGGLTSELAYVRACDDLDEGKPQDGLKRIDAARQKHPADTGWRLAWARYLDLIQDPRAKQEWVALGDQEANNLDVQWSALGARAAQQDHDFLGRTIDRLRAQVGEEGLTWRIARAQWLLNGNPGQKETAEAMLILNEVTRSAPNMLAPRLLLAACMQRAGNLTGAIDQLATAYGLDPSSNTTALQLVGLLQQQGDFGRASQYLGKVLEPAASATPWERRTAAMLLARQGNSDQALKMLQDVDQKMGGADATDTMLASLYVSRGEPEKAEKIYRKLLETPNAQVIQIVSDFYASQGRTADAEATLALLDKLPQLKPGAKDFILGEHYRVAGDERQALDHLKAAATADPKNAQFWRQWVTAEVRFEHASEALAVAKQASAALGESAAFHRLLDAAAPVAAVGDEPVARQLILQLLDGEADDGSAAALQLLADAKAQNRDLTSVLPQLRPLANKHPQVLPLQNVTARLDLAAAEYDDAATVATRAMQAFPNAVEPAELAQAALAATGRWSEALSVAEQWRQRSMARPLEADLAIATAALAQRDPTRALRQVQPYLARAQAGDRSRAPALALAAQAQVLSGKMTEAAALLRPLLDKSPAWRGTWMEMACAQVPDKAAAAQWLDQVAPLIPADGAGERVQLARSWFRLSQRTKEPADVEKYKSLLAQSAAELESASSPPAPAVLTLALLQEESGDQDAAEKSYRRALKIDANLPVAQNNLAMILLRRGGDLKEAADLASKAASSREPNAASFWETLASIHAKMSDRDKAAVEYRTAIKLAPDRVAWRISLAEVLADAGRASEARAALQNVQSDDPRLTDAARQRLTTLLARLASASDLGSRPARVTDAK
jgi:Tfp pilus assembly protein PilF